MNRLLNRLSPEIALPNTFTDDLDWKFDIKTGDMFDALDGEGVRYKSTCLATRSQQVANY